MLAPEEFRAAMAAMPTAVTVVTAMGEDGPRGATANAVASVSLSPPLMLASLDRGSRTLAAVEATGRFGVNVLAAGHDQLARAFSTKSPTAEKWDGVEWARRADVPALAGVVLWLACELRDLHDGGDHVIATGLVLEADAPGGDPLLFHAGSYRPFR
jgi:flavin reductase (DIM6/NTAB) family NADH-FMN oxidoreductase RutF